LSKTTLCGILIFMSEASIAYELTSHLHETFLGENNVITDEERNRSGVRLADGEINKTLKIHVGGYIDGKPCYQSLAKDKFGNFHLSTVSCEHGPGNPHTQIDIRPESPDVLLDFIAESLFMQALIHLAVSRQRQRDVIRSASSRGSQAFLFEVK
jgi:hypothetical protein